MPMFLQDFLKSMLEPFSGYERIALDVGVALCIVLIGVVIGYMSRFVIIFLMERIGINSLLSRFLEENPTIWKEPIDPFIWKILSWFIGVLFLREAISYLGFTEIESFLTHVIRYLPQVFIAIFIGFFGIRVSRAVYTITSGALAYYDKQIAAILANVARGIVLFFTFVIILENLNTEEVEIVSEFIKNTFVVWFVASISLAFWLAFGLWGRDFACKLLEEVHLSSTPPKAKKTSTQKKNSKK